VLQLFVTTSQTAPPSKAPPGFYVGLFFFFILMVWVGWRSWTGPVQRSKDLRFHRGPSLGIMGIGGILCFIGAGCLLLLEHNPNFPSIMRALVRVGAVVALLPGCLLTVTPLISLFWIPQWARSGAGTIAARKQVRTKMLSIMRRNS
jgi:hypothetical protein